jgi:hypothetical protein
MSDDAFTKQLSRFTPDAGGLDRDQMLFAAGRASARPNRRWRALAGAMAASQLMTFGVLLWPRDSSVPVSATAPTIVASTLPLQSATNARVVDAAEIWSRREMLFSDNGLPPAPAPIDDVTPDEPPLRAFGPLPAAFLND